MRNLFSNKIERSQLEAADHIYGYRDGYIYSHHGIYVGKNRVIHFTRTEEEIRHNSKLNTSSNFSRGSTTTTSGSNSTTISNPNVSCCTVCGYQPHQQRGVVKTCLDCFLKGHDDLYRCKYWVSEYHKFWKRPGSFNTSSCDLPEKVMERATYMLNHKAFGEYDISDNNCESFAVYCKTGYRASAQGDMLIKVQSRLGSIQKNAIEKIHNKMPLFSS